MQSNVTQQRVPVIGDPSPWIHVSESPRHVRVFFGGETIADSKRAKLMHETGLLPVYYFPREDVRGELLEESGHTTHCHFKGDASYWSVRVGDKVAENAAWSYPEPIDSARPLAGLIAFYWRKMDHWYEEDEEVFVHPRDPYHRVDVLDSSRHVKVTVNGEVVAETQRPKLLFETGLPTRYYFPPEDVREEALVPSDKQTQCPYKGMASYWSVEAGGGRVEDLLWYYPDPIPEARKIKDHLCFFNERVDLEVRSAPSPRVSEALSAPLEAQRGFPEEYRGLLSGRSDRSLLAR